MKFVKIAIVIFLVFAVLCSPFLIVKMVFSASKLVDTIPKFASELRVVKSREMARDFIAKGHLSNRLAEFTNGSWILFRSKNIYKYTSNISDYEKPWFVGLKFDNGDILFIVDESGSTNKFCQFQAELSDLLDKQSYEQKFFMRDTRDFCAKNNLVMFQYE